MTRPHIILLCISETGFPFQIVYINNQRDSLCLSLLAPIRTYEPSLACKNLEEMIKYFLELMTMKIR